jgi:hypothetical protein
MQSFQSTKRFQLLLFSIYLLIVLQSIWVAYKMRPIQDDYFNLQSVQQMGVLGYLEDTWLHHGGNLVQFFIHCLIILPTTQGFVFWNLSIFFLVSQLIVIFTVFRLIRWINNNHLPANQLAVWLVPLLTLVGFEGLFVPGFLGTFGFSLASLAHLWPVCATVIALTYCADNGRNWALTLVLGLIAGNSNLGESAFAVLSLLLIYFIIFRRPILASSLNFKSTKPLATFTGATIFGTIVIAVAPGFWNRASDQIGLPENFFDLAKRFFQSFASFTGDALTHPMILVVFAIGYLFGVRLFSGNVNLNLDRTKALYFGTLFIWGFLILGSTAAYPAWHQSMGMYVLLIPAAFFTGLTVRNRQIEKFISSILILSSLIMTLCFIRIGVLSTTRAEMWDQNLELNICRIQLDPEAPLLGAEVQYPPFGFGIDDVNTWEWMRYKYVGWVQNIVDKKSCNPKI